MGLNVLDQSWQALLHTEQQLLHKFRSLRRALPPVERPPDPQPQSKSVEPQMFFGGLLNNLNSPPPRVLPPVYRPSLDISLSPPIRDLIGRPRRPLARRVTGVHSRSNFSMKKHRDVNADSPRSSRSNSAERREPPRLILRRRKDGLGEKQKLSALLSVSPLRERRPMHHSFVSHPASRYLDHMIRNQAYQRGFPCKSHHSMPRSTRPKRQGSEPVRLNTRALPRGLKLADEDDEDKCVVEGGEDLLVHLPKYL